MPTSRALPKSRDRPRSTLVSLLLAALCLCSKPAGAFELQTLLVTHQAGRYEVQVQARFARSPVRVFAVLTAFERAPLLNPSIKSMVVVPGEGGLRSESHAEGCFVGFCRELFHVQQLTVVRTAEGGRIDAVTLPVASSSFASGENHINVQASGDGSLFILRSISVPSFWLPPWLGPYAVQRRLREEALNTLANLERLSGE